MMDKASKYILMNKAKLKSAGADNGCQPLAAQLLQKWPQEGTKVTARQSRKQRRANRGIRRIRGKAIFRLAQKIYAGSENFYGTKISSQLANMLGYRSPGVARPT